MNDPLVMNDDQQTVYEMVGGDATFKALVDAFYRRIEADPDLRPMFPDDLEPGKHWQFLFLAQYWGGPARYAEERGHPRLRMRHAPYPVTPDAAQKWLSHMVASIDEVSIAEPARGMMIAYFERGSSFMVNTNDTG